MTDDKPENNAIRKIAFCYIALLFFITIAIEKDANRIYNITAINGVINDQVMSS